MVQSRSTLRTWMDYLAVMDLKWENPVQLPMKFTIKEELSTPKNVPTPEPAHLWKHLSQTHASTVTWIGPLISSNCKNRRITKWEWCSFRHQTLPEWAIVLAIVWVFSAQENNRCRIGLLIFSDCRNRRIRKWKWCFCRHQTIPRWAIVLTIVWVILRANGPGSLA